MNVLAWIRKCLRRKDASKISNDEVGASKEESL